MQVPKGTRIIALDENRELVSEGDWHPEASQIIDFSARYVDPCGRTTDGELVYGNRGFSYATQGEKWDFVNK